MFVLPAVPVEINVVLVVESGTESLLEAYMHHTNLRKNIAPTIQKMHTCVVRFYLEYFQFCSTMYTLQDIAVQLYQVS